jgi:hypothetical protein
MPLRQVRNANFGKTYSNLTSSLGVGFTLMDTSGSVVGTRMSSSVYQLASGSGIYASYIEFPDNFRGQILWDTGTEQPPTVYAAEEYNVEENNPLVQETYLKLLLMSGSVETIRDFQAGRWHISGNVMRFYKEDNVTLIASFNLFDSSGTPSSDSVFQRTRI